MGAIKFYLLHTIKGMRECRGLVALLGAVSSAALLQLDYWYGRNGAHFTGHCVNHFGDEYPCSVIGWIVRPLLSPFAWPGLVFVFAAAWVGVTFLYILVRRISPQIQTLKPLPAWLTVPSRICSVVILGGSLILWLYGLSLMVFARSP